MTEIIARREFSPLYIGFDIAFLLLFAFRPVYRQLFLIKYFYDRQKAERTNKEADAVE